MLYNTVKSLHGILLMSYVWLLLKVKSNKMIKTTSYSHYKTLKSKGISVELVTKTDLNKKHHAR